MNRLYFYAGGSVVENFCGLPGLLIKPNLFSLPKESMNFGLLIIKDNDRYSIMKRVPFTRMLDVGEADKFHG